MLTLSDYNSMLKKTFLSADWIIVIDTLVDFILWSGNQNWQILELISIIAKEKLIPYSWIT